MSDIKKTFWEALDSSPNVMIGLSDDNNHLEPMRAQLDKDANGEFWFFTSKTNRIAKCGKATAQFSNKGHNVFACIRGHLIEETRQDVLDAHWSRQAESWFEKGKDDPELIMLRFELDDAEIWHVSPDLSGLLKLAVGKNVEPEEMGERETVQFR
ncbi:pyridoxamine 5'-phosphate oxidase family protein [Pseudoalteromonas piscicida]|uniref:pyridoxamine 5'-phosphate oxidase family protein n=1 Tax=Pseudoalteromonas piscicida TaxID=43662 RepID=UPI0027E4BF7B|nr:pyridoxamine 5'-phosphate oxidase family protein [Pseudoalteromonas piscicida]WMO16147.1 pyridoxamine 5'-phosphate oxidase family protein [Pseudoalteromonas piscicida]